MVVLSCKQTKGINAVTIHKDGNLLTSKVTRISSDLNVYQACIEGYKIAFWQLKHYLEREQEDIVVIECGNNIFSKWLISCEPSSNYAEEFFNLIEILDEIPTVYTIAFKKKLLADNYAQERYIKQFKMEKFDVV